MRCDGFRFSIVARLAIKSCIRRRVVKFYDPFSSLSLSFSPHSSGAFAPTISRPTRSLRMEKKSYLPIDRNEYGPFRILSNWKESNFQPTRALYAMEINAMILRGDRLGTESWLLYFPFREKKGGIRGGVSRRMRRRLSLRNLLECDRLCSGCTALQTCARIGGRGGYIDRIAARIRNLFPRDWDRVNNGGSAINILRLAYIR